MPAAKLPFPVYGWKPVQLANNLSPDQLQTLRRAVETDPASSNPAHANGDSIFLYTVAARRKLDAIAWAITFQLAEQKRSAGDPK